MSAADIVIIDDDPGGGANTVAANLRLIGLTATAITPEELVQAHLNSADLILVDYLLEYWVDPRDERLLESPLADQPVARRPSNGLALAAVIRSVLPDDGRPRGVALLSAQLHELVKDFSPSVTEHAAARINGIDWAFDKKVIKGLPDLNRRIESFAHAISTLQRVWHEDDADREQELVEMLAVREGAAWATVAVTEIHAAQPPINQLATASHGLSLLRWLGQRILPYPTFLVDAPRLAMACGIDPDELENDLGPEQLEGAFGAFRYQGPLADFLGPRWWRAGVRQKVRELAGDSLPGPGVAESLGVEVGTTLRALDPPTSVMAIDGELNPVGPVARENAVRVRPDDWPAFAETGWMTRKLVAEHPHLIDLVDPADRALVEDNP
jgi:hypothetical protein